MAAAQRGALDIVLVQRLDRWSRSTLGMTDSFCVDCLA
jgi:hypothetical protein